MCKFQPIQVPLGLLGMRSKLLLMAVDTRSEPLREVGASGPRSSKRSGEPIRMVQWRVCDAQPLHTSALVASGF